MRCPSAQAVGLIVGAEDLVQLVGTFGVNSDGITCGYGRAGDPPDIVTNGSMTATHRPGADNLSVSVMQAHVGSLTATTVERIANSLLAISDSLDITFSDGVGVAVTSGYLRVGRTPSAWLMFKSATVLAYFNVKVAATDELGPEQAREQLVALARLVGVVQ